MTSAKIMLKIDGEGRLHTDAETLERLKNQQFELYMAGDTVTLTRSSEPQTPEERAASVHEWMSRTGRRSGVSWPTDYNLRDDLYD